MFQEFLMSCTIGSTRFIEQDVIINGVRLRVLTAGEETGQPVICLHGFPDTPHTFEHQYPLLLQQGYRIIAPWQRGYPPSQTGSDIDYFPQRLIEDATALVEFSGRDDVILLGHDWGAMACFGAAQQVPEKIAVMIVIAVPHATAFARAGGYLTQAWRSRYAMFFQLGPLANWVMRRNNMAGLDYLWSYWSPDWDYTEADIQPLKDCLGQPGAMAAATGYYRATVRGAMRDKRFSELLLRVTSVPTLVCAGLNDGCIGADYFAAMDEGFSGQWRFVGIEGAGHFVHREAPQQFNQALLEQLGAAAIR
jgi:pimeloyl-ACP methyl ester carboxylesterase